MSSEAPAAKTAPDSTPPAASRRNTALDVLRAAAVVLVMGRHLDGGDIAGLGPVGGTLFGAWHRAGWVGVDLFFVLSGFLVSGLLFREHQRLGRPAYGRFLLRRGFKIYPAFYTFLIGYGLIKWLATRDLPARGLLGEIFFLQNYVGHLWTHTWSLAVEEHFYLGIGLAVVILARTGSLRAVPWLFGGIAGLCLAGRAWLAWRHTGPDYVSAYLFPTHLRIDSLMFGVLLSYLYHFREPGLRAFVERWRWPILAASAALVAPPLFLEVDQSPYLVSFGLTANYLGFGGLMLLCFYRSEWFAGRRLMRAAAAVGAYSYSIYLWHLAAWRGLKFAQAKLAFTVPFALEALLYVALCIGVGVLAARIIEMPFLKLRDRFFPSRSGGLAKS